MCFAQISVSVSATYTAYVFIHHFVLFFQPRFRAMYDYDAADVDEVSFREGDVIFNTERIDEGWMLGTVEGSQQRGMLPANYVEQIK